MRTLLLLMTLFLFGFTSSSQTSVLDKKVVLNVKKWKAVDILSELEKQTGAEFNYQSGILPKNKRFSVHFNNLSLKECLNQLKPLFSITYKLIGDRSIVLKAQVKKKKFTITGTVYERKTKEKILDAFIYDENQEHIAQSNSQGFYSLQLPIKDSTVLIVARVGFKTQKIVLRAESDLWLDIAMSPILLDPIKIKRKHKRLSILHTGTTIITIKEVENFPTLFGETDVIKSLQLYPGIQSSNEGISGIVVRGGSPDQNLILLDGIPVYQASHLYGLYSIFNSDAIKKVSITKSNFSVQNSSRLSSLVDIRTKDGNKEKFGASGSIGLVSSKLMLEGPIKKDKTSFLISGRRSYLDIFGEPIISNINQELNDFLATYYFYDVNGKVHHQLSEKSHLTLSGYHGVDRTRIKNSHKLKSIDAKEKDVQDLTWENNLLSIKYAKLLHKKVHGNFSFIYSGYDITNSSQYEYSEDDRLDEIKHIYSTGIKDYALYGDFDWRPNSKQKISFGYASTYHRFTPGVVTYYRNIDGDEQSQETGSKLEEGLETRVFLEDRIKLGKKAYLQSGISYSLFMVPTKSYHSFQLQSSLRKKLGRTWIGHIAIGNSTQFLHYLPNSTIGLPTDIWLPSTSNIRPEEAAQIAIGAEYRKAVYSFKVEAYYKRLFGLLEYKEDANFLGTSSDWESKIEVGEGENYGIEIKWAKDEGKTKGWIAYTLSWANRQFDNINDGAVFPFRFDKRHDVSFVLNHELSKKKSVGMSWIFSSGSPTTVPTGSYLPSPDSYPYEEVYIYGNRNNFSMPNHHRLDLVYNYRTYGKKWEGVWSFGLYNAYNRLNPFYIAAGITEDEKRTYYQVGLFPVLPNISYQFKF